MTINYIFLDTETTFEKNLPIIFNEIVFVQFIIVKQIEFLHFIKNRPLCELKDFMPEVTIWRIEECGEKEKIYLKDLLLNKKNQLVLFNAPFDIAHLLKWLYPDEFFPGNNLFTYSKKHINCFIWDLFLMLKIIHPGYKENSLNHWSQRLYRLSLSKTLQTSFKKETILDNQLKTYMEGDVKILIYIWGQILFENYSWLNTHTNKKTSCYYIYKKYFCQLIFFSVDSCFRGLNIDVERVRETLKEKEGEKTQMDQIFADLTQIDPNLVKSSQTFGKNIVPLLEEYVVDLIPKTPTGLFKFSFREFRILLEKHHIESPIFRALTDVLKKRREIILSKNLLKNIKKIFSAEGAHNKLFFNFKIAGATTGRVTTSNYNLQGLPYFLRSGIVPAKGNIFVIADVSQEEVRIMAEISKEKELLKIFNQKLDFHANTGAIITDTKYEKFLEFKETDPEFFKSKRALAKSLNFGLFYGMGPITLQKHLEVGNIFLPRKETEVYWRKWHRNYPGVQDYQKTIVENLWASKNKGCKPVFSSYLKSNQNLFFITSLGGRVKRNNELDVGNIDYKTFKKTKNFLTECSNFPVQATGADLLSEIWQELEKTLWEKGRVVLTVHDEIIIETKPHLYEEVKKSIEKVALVLGEKYLPSVGLSFDISGPETSWTKP